jgi:hypothetical protein
MAESPHCEGTVHTVCQKKGRRTAHSLGQTAVVCIRLATSVQHEFHEESALGYLPRGNTRCCSDQDSVKTDVRGTWRSMNMSEPVLMATLECIGNLSVHERTAPHDHLLCHLQRPQTLKHSIYK